MNSKQQEVELHSISPLEARTFERDFENRFTRFDFNPELRPAGLVITQSATQLTETWTLLGTCRITFDLNLNAE